MTDSKNKRAYTAPSLTSYGSIAKLTQGGGSDGGGGGPLIDIMIML
jgi:hypothetical protein